MQSGPPDRLTDKHRLISYMVAAGRSNREIAAALEISENRIAVVKSSPLFQALLDDVRAELRGTTLESVVAEMNREAGPTLRTLVQLRDGAETDAVRLGAAKELFSRQVPIVTRTKDERTVRIVLSPADTNRMQLALREAAEGEVDDVIDASSVTEREHAGESNSVDEVLLCGGYA